MSAQDEIAEFKDNLSKFSSMRDDINRGRWKITALACLMCFILGILLGAFITYKSPSIVIEDIFIPATNQQEPEAERIDT